MLYIIIYKYTFNKQLLDDISQHSNYIHIPIIYYIYLNKHLNLKVRSKLFIILVCISI